LCPLPIRYEYIERKIKIKEKAVFFFVLLLNILPAI